MAGAVERAMAGRAGEGGGAGGLLPEGLITAEPEAAAAPLQPTPTEVGPAFVVQACLKLALEERSRQCQSRNSDLASLRWDRPMPWLRFQPSTGLQHVSTPD
jgi:hypothetical protein